jgi:hypothetical protein
MLPNPKSWVVIFLQGFGALESELAEAYDFVSPCFPPHYNIFDIIFQMYHVQFAQVRAAACVLLFTTQQTDHAAII